MTILHSHGLIIFWHIHTILCLSVTSLLFPVLTIFLIICLSLFLLISHFPLIVPQSLSPMRVLCKIPRLHLFHGPRLLQAITINTVSVLLVTCLRYQMSLFACCAPHCVSHFKMLDQLCSSYLASFQQASAQCLPHVRKRKTCMCSGLERFCQQAKAVCQILVPCLVGLRLSFLRCCSSNQAKKAKNRYKYEVHCLRRQQLYITCRRIGSALSDARH